MKKFLVVHMTNGVGYSEPTITKDLTLPEILEYVRNTFPLKKIEVDFKGGVIGSFFHTSDDDEQTTERITVFEIDDKNKYLLSVYANCTEAGITCHKDLQEAIKAMREAGKIVTEEIETSPICIAGECVNDKEEGYHIFQII